MYISVLAYQKPHVRSLLSFLCMLTVAVALSSSDDTAVRCVLSVMSCDTVFYPD